MSDPCDWDGLLQRAKANDDVHEAIVGTLREVERRLRGTKPANNSMLTFTGGLNRARAVVGKMRREEIP